MGLLDNENFLVFGLGKSGKAVARLLAANGKRVSVSDDSVAAVAESIESRGYGEFTEKIAAFAAPDAADELSGIDVLVVSPGVPLEHDLLRKAAAAGIPIVGEIEIAYEFCDCPIIGVTGTNGKSTVVKVIGAILDAARKKNVVAGNIGTPFSAVVDDGEEYELITLELSSFQLDTIDNFKCDVAVLLNVTADHLDRYGDSFEKYSRSKERILNRAGAETVFVYNAEDPVCAAIAEDHDCLQIPFSSERVLADGVFAKDEFIVRSIGGVEERVIAIADFPPVGVHNLENALAAVAAVTPFDIDKASIRDALASYTPLAHRMEPVRTVGGVDYINDSKATNVDATIKSLRSIDGKVVLILGGLDKNGDFRPLLDYVDRLRQVILIGSARDKIRSVLDGKCELSESETLEEAVLDAAKAAARGDTVLLAPACASFDMFKSYADRGEVFRAAVNAL